MSTVFLIGNGFDLSCGMKTRYVDVYNSYCKSLESDTEVIKRFKQDISSDYKNWCDFEEGMAEYAKSFDSEDDFVECIKDFRNYLHNYLKQEENRFNEQINNEELTSALIEEMHKSILAYYSGMIPRISNTVKEINQKYSNDVSFISFNYTTAFDNLVKLTFGSERVLHIHGQLDKYLIMGMDNEEQIHANYALTQRGKQTFLKPHFNNEINPQNIEIAKNKIERANIIYVFGLSLGKSDLTWRTAILNSLSTMLDHHLFLFDYQLACEHSLLENDKLDSELLKRNAILESWGIKNSEYYINKIHIPCGQKIFNIKEVIENFKKQEEE